MPLQRNATQLNTSEIHTINLFNWFLICFGFVYHYVHLELHSRIRWERSLFCFFFSLVSSLPFRCLFDAHSRNVHPSIQPIDAVACVFVCNTIVSSSQSSKTSSTARTCRRYAVNAVNAITSIWRWSLEGETSQKTKLSSSSIYYPSELHVFNSVFIAKWFFFSSSAATAGSGSGVCCARKNLNVLVTYAIRPQWPFCA